MLSSVLKKKGIEKIHSMRVFQESFFSQVRQKKYLLSVFFSGIVLFLIFTWFGEVNNKNNEFQEGGWIKTSTANLRTDPFVLASIVDILVYNTPFKIISRTKKSVRIASGNRYWYKVRLENKIEGWLYGSVISQTINKEDSKSEIKYVPVKEKENMKKSNKNIK